MPRPLTFAELAHYKERLLASVDPRRVVSHFTVDGDTFDIVTGKIIADKSMNRINKLVYWNFDAHDAKEIAKLCGVKVTIERPE